MERFLFFLLNGVHLQEILCKIRIYYMYFGANHQFFETVTNTDLNNDMAFFHVPFFKILSRERMRSRVVREGGGLNWEGINKRGGFFE